MTATGNRTAAARSGDRAAGPDPRISRGARHAAERADQQERWIVPQPWRGDFYERMRAVWGLLTGANSGRQGPAVPQPRHSCPECGGVTLTRVGIPEAICGGRERIWRGLDAARLGSVA